MMFVALHAMLFSVHKTKSDGEVQRNDTKRQLTRIKTLHNDNEKYPKVSMCNDVIDALMGESEELKDIYGVNP